MTSVTRDSKEPHAGRTGTARRDSGGIMATLREVEEQVWSSVVPGLGYNEAAAIARKWRALKDQSQPIGVPVSEETAVEDGHVAQAFTSGNLLVWVGGDEVEVR
jgi:hypothetical protein